MASRGWAAGNGFPAPVSTRHRRWPTDVACKLETMLPKAERIRAAAQEDRCPQCGEALGRTPEEGRRVGTGSFADGVFCGLECLSEFHGEYYSERIEHGLPSPN